MESDKNHEVINIATGDPEVVKSVIDKINSTYDSKFKLLYSEDRGGVEFSVVDRAGATNDEIFLLGFYYGAKVKELRDKKEIDW